MNTPISSTAGVSILAPRATGLAAAPSAPSEPTARVPRPITAAEPAAPIPPHGPNARPYDIPPDLSPVPGNPRATLRKLDFIYRAAARQPSPADRMVELEAARLRNKVRAELAEAAHPEGRDAGAPSELLERALGQRAWERATEAAGPEAEAPFRALI